jgi:hypothetical protein
VGPLGLCDWAFDCYVIYFPTVVSALSLGFKVGIGASNDCKDFVVGVPRFVVEVGVVDWLQF